MFILVYVRTHFNENLQIYAYGLQFMQSKIWTKNMITNLHKATKLDNTPITEEDLKVGLEVYMKHGSGVIRCKCILDHEEHAIFESINPDWPMKTIMRKNVDDFTLGDFDELKDALEGFSCQRLATDEQRVVVAKADEMGYANYMSYTQAGWTEKGIEKYRELEGENTCQPVM